MDCPAGSQSSYCRNTTECLGWTNDRQIGNIYPPPYVVCREGSVLTHVCLSTRVSTLDGGGVPTLDRGVHTLDGWYLY